MWWRLAVMWAVLGASAGFAGDYTGPGACASASCHGSASARSDSAVALQNEYGTWRREDRHAQAGLVLRSALARRIVAQAELRGPAEAVPRCLVCHAPASIASATERAASLDDGVSCEACHGAAASWIARHTEQGWTHAASVERDLRDLRDPSVAVERCLDCHLGRGDDTVDHDLLAAGHPLLTFDLDTFATTLPAHWAPHDDNGAWFDGRAWLAGQAAVARRVATQATRPRAPTAWPDFALYECDACHHEINRDPSYPLHGGGERPALDAWFAPGWLAALDVVMPARADAVRSALATVATRGEWDATSAATIDAAARACAERARTPLPAGAFAAIGRALVTRAPGSFRSAQQQAWGLDALAVARGTTDDAAPARVAIGRLFPALKSLVRFDHRAYDAALNEVRTAW